MPATKKRRCTASVARKMPPLWLFARQPHHLSAPSLKARACAHTVRRTVCVAASFGGSSQGRAACAIFYRLLASAAFLAAASPTCRLAVSVRRAAGVDASDAKAAAERAARGTGSPFAAAVFFRSLRASAEWLPFDRGDRVFAAGQPHFGRGRQPYRQSALTFFKTAHLQDDRRIDDIVKH